MNERNLTKAVSDLPLGGCRFYSRVSSTNDVALAWAADGAPDQSLVYAEEQTAGKGRGGRQWFTQPWESLAFSLVLKPHADEELSVSLFSGLGALAVCEALEKRGLHPEIKWPNDILLDLRKVCGVLVETVWIGEKVDSIILGIGLNVKPGSVPAAEGLNYPATSIEVNKGEEVSRLPLLHDVLQAILRWRDQLTSPEFIRTWEAALAFQGETVEIQLETGTPIIGKLESLRADGSLQLRSPDGKLIPVQFGEVHLRKLV
jgi:BirA family transcriptional regulator, biotin operon repressor / biotin---[acetyl-CoA-carboxylase] ligase